MTDLPEIAWSGPALVYPMPARAAVDTFDQFDFHVRRYLRSDHYRRAIATGGEVAAFYAHALWCLSFEESPVGTIPGDEYTQAMMLGLGADIKRWRRIAPLALVGFHPVQIDGRTSGRLANPVMLAVCLAAYERKLDHEREKRRRAMAMARRRLAQAALEAGFKEAIPARTADLMLDWMRAHDYGQSDIEGVVAARVAVQGGWRPDAGVVPFPERQAGGAGQAGPRTRFD